MSPPLAMEGPLASSTEPWSSPHQPSLSLARRAWHKCRNAASLFDTALRVFSIPYICPAMKQAQYLPSGQPGGGLRDEVPACIAPTSIRRNPAISLLPFTAFAWVNDANITATALYFTDYSPANHSMPVVMAMVNHSHAFPSFITGFMMRLSPTPVSCQPDRPWGLGQAIYVVMAAGDCFPPTPRFLCLHYARLHTVLTFAHCCERSCGPWRPSQLEGWSFHLLAYSYNVLTTFLELLGPSFQGGPHSYLAGSH
jgi:hypothetical protein